MKPFARSNAAVALPAALLLAGLAAACAPAGAPGAPGASGDLLPGRSAACATILSTNDAHGRLLAATYSFSRGREVGGSAVLAGYFGDIRESSDCPVFLVSGGDVMQGTLISNLSDGASMIDVMNHIGYDAVATGNHEFDWGIDTFRDRIAEAEFPFLGANIFLRGTDRHPDWLRPWVIVERQGVRVGFIGMTTRSTPTTTRPDNVESLEFGSISGALDRYIPEVLAEGADFVVAVMHAGAICDDEGLCRGEAIDELRAVTGRVDYAVGGHTHSRNETTVRGIPLVQSFSNTTAFGHGRLERDGDDVRARIVDIVQTYADRTSPDAEIARLVEAHLVAVHAQMERRVARLAEAMETDRGNEFALGNLIADAQRAATNAQVAIMNNGGIRRGLPAGPVRYADLFELQPFANTLVVLELDGASLLAALDHALDGRVEGAPDAHVSGLTVRYAPRAPAGQRVREARLDDGSAILPDEVYRVTVNDFMAAGGSGYTMFMNARDARLTGIVDLDALEAHLGGLPQPVQPPTTNRWQVVP